MDDSMGCWLEVGGWTPLLRDGIDGIDQGARAQVPATLEGVVA